MTPQPPWRWKLGPFRSLRHWQQYDLPPGGAELHATTDLLMEDQPWNVTSAMLAAGIGKLLRTEALRDAPLAGTFDLIVRVRIQRPDHTGGGVCGVTLEHEVQDPPVWPPKGRRVY